MIRACHAKQDTACRNASGINLLVPASQIFRFLFTLPSLCYRPPSAAPAAASRACIARHCCTDLDLSHNISCWYRDRVFHSHSSEE